MVKHDEKNDGGGSSLCRYRGIGGLVHPVKVEALCLFSSPLQTRFVPLKSNQILPSMEGVGEGFTLAFSR